MENRRRAAGEKVRRHDPVRKISRESTAVPAPDANAELQASIQVLHNLQDLFASVYYICL